MSPKSVAKICLRKRSVQLRLSSSVQSVARPSYSQSSFLSGKGSGTLRSSVVHSPGRASSNPLAWLASPLPGLFPLPPTRPASVVPGLSTSAPRRGYNGDQGRCPEKSHAAAPPAVPALHVRSYKSAGWTGLTTPRSWQFTSTSGRRRASPSIRPYYSTGEVGGSPKSAWEDGRSDCDPQAASNRLHDPAISRAVFFPEKEPVLFGPP